LEIKRWGVPLAIMSNGSFFLELFQLLRSTKCELIDPLICFHGILRCVGEQAFKRLKTQSTSLVSFSSADTYPPDGVNEKCWRTTGGFTWMAKPNVEMQLADFPPFRFGAEFVFKDKCWTPCLDLKSREVFYGGSMWKIIASNINQDKSQDDWLFGVHCRCFSFMYFSVVLHCHVLRKD
jgi:hypothetical protein